MWYAVNFNRKLFYLRCEDAEVSRKLVESKVAVLEGMRDELRRAHELNQLLKDQKALVRFVVAPRQAIRLTGCFFFFTG